MPPSSPNDNPARRLRVDRWTLALLGLLVVAFALRLWGVKSGLPHAYNVDENAHFVPRAIGFFDHTLNPYYFVNPPLLSYVFYVVFAVWFGGGGDVARAYATDPTEVWVVARVTVAVLSTGAVLLTYVAGARLFDRRVGLLAAAVLAFAFLPVFYAHLALNDGPAMAAVALSLVGTALVLRRGRMVDYAIAGVGLGLAISTKYTAGIVIVPLLVASFFRWRDEPGTPRTLRELIRPRGLRTLLRSPAVRGLVLVAGGTTLLAFAVTNPYAIRSNSEFLDGIRRQSSATSGSDKLGAGDRSGWEYYLWTLTWGFGWVPLLAAAGGALALIRRERRLAWLLVPAVVVFFVFMGSQQRFFGRWFLPVYPILCLMAAYGAVELVRGLGRLRPRLRPALATLAVIALVGQGVVYSVHNDAVNSRDDTRQLTRDWLLENVPLGSRVVVEPVVTDSWLIEPRRALAATSDGSLWRVYDGDAAFDSPGLIAADAASPRSGGGTASDQLLDRTTVSLFPGQLPPGALPGRRRPSAGVVGAEGYTRGLRPALVDAYEREGYCYVVTGSNQYERAFAEPRRVPQAIAYYRKLERDGKIVFRASPYDEGEGPVDFNFDWSFDYYPLAYHRPGPEMVVYRLSGGRCGRES